VNIETRVGAGAEDSWTVAGRPFRSRLIIGTGKYKSFEENAAAAEASGAEIVTVAVRRVNIADPNQPMLTDFIDPKRFTYLPNTAGCFTAEDAIRTLRLAREAGGWELVKLEVLGEARTLYPNMIETIRATEVLAKEGFLPMVYCTDDPIAARQLEDAGAVAVMPLGAPIGSGLGIQNEVTIRLIVEGAKVPVLVDAGVGTASDAGRAMELGCDGVLMNTAIAEAKDPVMMARAMKLAVESGRLAYRAGRMGKRRYADPSSPLAGLI
jgi:thiazole synthase